MESLVYGSRISFSLIHSSSFVEFIYKKGKRIGKKIMFCEINLNVAGNIILDNVCIVR